MTPPPYRPDPGLICWIEDPWHGPSRPRRWTCWLIFWRHCPHRLAFGRRCDPYCPGDDAAEATSAAEDATAP